MDDDYFPRRSVSADHPLPSPSDTPYQTPHLSASRVSSFDTPISSTPLTPPPLPPDTFLKIKQNGVNGNSSTYDPGHFTPTLHASLVSEILSLRRELDSKHSFIDTLESSLASAKAENDTLQNNFRRSNKETRALKRELQLHEDGTLSAVESLAKERDDVGEANKELRRKTETIQKRLRTQEDDNRVLKTALEQERGAWTKEKRALDRRATLAEHRLDAVIRELAEKEVELEQQHRINETLNHSRRQPADPMSEDLPSQHSSPARTRHPRKEHGSISSIKQVHQSLADELNFSEPDDGPIEEEHATTNASHSSTIRAFDYEEKLELERSKRLSQTEDGKARRVLGMVSVFEEQLRNAATTDRVRDSIIARSLSDISKKYKRDGTSQSVGSVDGDAFEGTSPSTGSGQAYMDEQLPSEQAVEEEEGHHQLPPSDSMDIGANQRRKREPPSRNEDKLQDQLSSDLPATDSGILASQETGQVSRSAPVEMRTASTQTEPLLDAKQPDAAADSSELSTPRASTPAMPSRPPPPPPVPDSAVPAIAIHPPEPGTQSSRLSTVLPPNTRNVGCQANFKTNVSMKTTGMQTEAIRVDKRSVKLPAHLLPSALDFLDKSAKEPVVPSKPVARGLEERDETLRRPVELQANEGASRPRDLTISTNTLPTVDGHDSEFGDDFDDLNLSDGEYVPSFLASRLSKRSQRLNRAFSPPAPVPENEKFVLGSAYEGPMRTGFSSRSSLDKGKKNLKDVATSDSAYQYHSRLAFLTRHGSTAGSRSPSVGSLASSSNISKASGPRPPFAIPTRRSSKEPKARRRLRASGQSSPSRASRSTGLPSPAFTSGQTSPKRRETGRLFPRSPPPALRKARSAAAIADNGPAVSIHNNQSTVPTSFARVLRSSGQQAAIPLGGFTQSLHEGDGETGPSVVTTMLPTGNASVGSSHQHSVVDAITATMIGEWMWKYVRKRKSFGMTDSGPEGSKTSDARHKRWVWLSPYERTVMWSSKQPTSNAALMGKTGRKLTITSVLDVKDDTLPPKGARESGIFSRSIMVLTPARALKFTAANRERHYLWLTALSFLSQQSASNIPKDAFVLFPPSATETGNETRRSRASSFRNTFKNGRAIGSQGSSGHETPVAQQMEANAQRQPPTGKVPDSAFAPTVPRVPHSRKRSTTGPSRGRPAAGGAGSTYGQNSGAVSAGSVLSIGNSSNRVHSTASLSRRSIARDGEEEGDVPTLDLGLMIGDRQRQSMKGAEFGGNNNFFDAVGVVRMDAFMKSGVFRPASAKSNGEEEPVRGHRRGKSSGSFNGPPDISRARQLRRVGHGLGGNEKSGGFFRGF